MKRRGPIGVLVAAWGISPTRVIALILALMGLAGYAAFGHLTLGW